VNSIILPRILYAGSLGMLSDKEVDYLDVEIRKGIRRGTNAKKSLSNEAIYESQVGVGVWSVREMIDINVISMVTEEINRGNETIGGRLCVLNFKNACYSRGFTSKTLNNLMWVEGGKRFTIPLLHGTRTELFLAACGRRCIQPKINFEVHANLGRVYMDEVVHTAQMEHSFPANVLFFTPRPNLGERKD
jgi:hypothetical protein